MTPGQIFALVVLFVGVPAMFVHKTAAVLVGAWVFNMAWWKMTGDSLPLTAFLLTDAIAFGLILSWRATWADTAVLCIYPIMWTIYAMGFAGAMGPRSQWWWLYGLAMAQFLIAGPWPAFLKNRTETGRRGGISKPILTRDNL